MPYREEYLESAILDLIEIQAWYDSQQLVWVLSFRML